MKHLFLLAASAFFCGVGCADDQREEKPRFKGVELYSWKDKGEWVFVMVNGTNELKAPERVKGDKSQIRSVEDLKKAFARLAEKEMVFWTHPVGGFEFPPEATRKAIQEAAKAAKIDLVIDVKKE